MCSKKSTKTEESNKKRLESLNERLNEFQLKKKLVRLSLHDLDSANKPKKIIFDDDDDEENVPKTVVNEEVEEPVKPKKAKKEKKEKEISTFIEEVKEKPKPEISNGESKKKLKLMDSDSENEEDTLKMLDSKVNLDQKKANKLIYLKTKFSNDDQRFKIDERFAENEEDVEDRSVKEEEEEEYNKEDDEDEDARPKKSNKKQLKKEKLSALKILEEITAKPILKPTEEPGSIEEKKLLKRREMLKSKPIVRYDPTKEEHKKFEINEDKEKELSSSDDSDKEEESRKGDDENEEVEEEKPPKIEEDTSKYFKVEPNLKDLFSSHDVFKFKFTQDESSESEKDEEDEENEEEEPARPINKLKPNLLLPTKRSKYSSSSSSESEYEGNDDEEYHEIENRKSQAREMNSSKQPMVRKPNLSEQNASFLPDFDKSKDILDALDYFANRKDDENCDLEKFRNEWSSQREKLVEECKKKHKRMIRIKKAQENKKLLPWRTSNKSIIKRNKTKK